jgi:hypothetical protein
MACVAELSLPAQFVPDLLRKLAWRFYGKDARRSARKRASSKARIVIERSEFKPLLERLQGAFEHLRSYAAGMSLLLLFSHNIRLLIFAFGGQSTLERSEGQGELAAGRQPLNVFFAVGGEQPQTFPCAVRRAVSGCGFWYM